MTITLEEFVRTLNEDEYVVGDRVWLEGVRFRVAFEVTDIELLPAFRHSGRRLQKSPRQIEFDAGRKRLEEAQLYYRTMTEGIRKQGKRSVKKEKKAQNKR
jgi:hypothetical protein